MPYRSDVPELAARRYEHFEQKRADKLAFLINERRGLIRLQQGGSSSDSSASTPPAASHTSHTSASDTQRAHKHAHTYGTTHSRTPQPHTPQTPQTHWDPHTQDSRSSQRSERGGDVRSRRALLLQSERDLKERQAASHEQMLREKEETRRRHAELAACERRMRIEDKQQRTEDARERAYALQESRRLHNVARLHAKAIRHETAEVSALHDQRWSANERRLKAEDAREAVERQRRKLEYSKALKEDLILRKMQA